MSKIHFETKVFKIDSSIIIRLPQSASAKLRSRGMVMIEGSINGFPFQAALEPDGKRSHWFEVDKSMQKHVHEGDTVVLDIEPVTKWPEPKVPADLKKALVTNPKVHRLWVDITPIARWDWIRWIGATKNPETRKKHIEVALSKLNKGERRPCCFNRAMCTNPYLSQGGVLLEPTEITKNTRSISG